MKSTLADSLSLLLPALPKALVSPEAAERVYRTGKALAPIPRGGFECRLAENDPQVDLQQCILRENEEPARLLHHLAALEPVMAEAARPLWDRVTEFVKQWAEPSSLLYSGIQNIWLEFDVNDSSSTIPAPSIFLGLERKLSDEIDAYKVVASALQMLLSPLDRSLVESNLCRCFETCGKTARVSHVGVMLARRVQALRVNVKGLGFEGMEGYLSEIGYRAPRIDLHPLLERVATMVDRVTLCLDVGAHIFPRLGFECLALQQPHTFMDYLVECGICTLAKRDGMFAWSGYLDPPGSDGAWPDHLVVASLLQPPDQFGVLNRQMSHVKLVYQHQQPLQAKGYLWFGHPWIQAHSAQKETDPEVTDEMFNAGANVP